MEAPLPTAAPAHAPPAASLTPATTSLANLLATFVLRRTKAHLDLNLPPKTRLVQWITPTPTQQCLLSTLHTAALELYQ